MKAESVIRLFFAGLLLLLILEGALIWVFNQAAVLPDFHFGFLNALAGFLATAIGSILVFWSVRIQYTEGKGSPAPIAPTKKLIVDGPYTYTRNPMTLGAALFYLGTAVWFGSTAVICLILLVFAVLLTYIYRHETEELSERFGDDYLEYKKRTPFLIPDLRKRQG